MFYTVYCAFNVAKVDLIIKQDGGRLVFICSLILQKLSLKFLDHKANKNVQ